MSPRTAIWTTVAELVRAELLPAPEMVAVQDESLTVKVGNPNAVRAWARHLGLPQPLLMSATRYGSKDWQPAPGWCGFTSLYVFTFLGPADRLVHHETPGKLINVSADELAMKQFEAVAA